MCIRDRKRTDKLKVLDIVKASCRHSHLSTLVLCDSCLVSLSAENENCSSLSWFALHFAPGPTPVPLTEAMSVVVWKIVTTPQGGRGFPRSIQKLEIFDLLKCSVDNSDGQYSGSVV